VDSLSLLEWFQSTLVSDDECIGLTHRLSLQGLDIMSHLQAYFKQEIYVSTQELTKQFHELQYLSVSFNLLTGHA
jgi:hypothetical protein